MGVRWQRDMVSTALHSTLHRVICWSATITRVLPCKYFPTPVTAVMANQTD